MSAAVQSDALRLDYVLQPGDVQLLHNHQQLHTRTKFEDYPVSASQPNLPDTAQCTACPYPLILPDH